VPAAGSPCGPTTEVTGLLASKPVAVLVVEGEEDVRQAFCGDLSAAGYEPAGVASAAAARVLLAERSFPAAILDIFLPDGNGLSLVQDIRDRDAHAVVIVVTGFASLDTALTALRRGAYEYLCKPFTSEQLLQALRRGLERREVVLSNLRLAGELATLAQQLQAHRASLEGKVSEAETSLAAFTELPNKLSAAHEPGGALQVLCETAARLSGADLAALLAHRSGVFQVAAACGACAGVEEGCVLPTSPLLAAAMAEGHPVLATDLLLGSAPTDDHLAALGLGGAVVLAVRAASTTIGCLLCARRQPGGFSDETVSLLALIAAQAAIPLGQWLEQQAEPSPAERFIEINRLL